MRIAREASRTALPARDRAIVRAVANQVAEIAAMPVQLETIELWKGLNGLRPQRPMALIDQVPWDEMDVEGELSIQSADPFCQELEATLRRTLYAWHHLRVDMVVERYVDVPKIISRDGDDSRDMGGGHPVGGITAAHRGSANAYGWEEDAARTGGTRIAIDVEATAAVEEKAHACLDGVLDVRMQGIVPSFAVWDDLVARRGIEAVLLDLVDRPDVMQRVAARLTDARLAELDDLEERGLLGFGLDRINCAGAHSDELPATGFDPGRPRARDNWTHGMAQVFLTTSDAMFEEFAIPTAIRWFSRWGLGSYGCCEPLHDRVGSIRRIPGIRKISMSPWADVDRGAAAIGRDFVFSGKPNPAIVGMESWDAKAAERQIQATLSACRRNGCPVEITLKDIGTVRSRPQRLWEWAEIATRLVRA